MKRNCVRIAKQCADQFPIKMVLDGRVFIKSATSIYEKISLEALKLLPVDPIASFYYTGVIKKVCGVVSYRIVKDKIIDVIDSIRAGS